MTNKTKGGVGHALSKLRSLPTQRGPAAYANPLLAALGHTFDRARISISSDEHHRHFADLSLGGYRTGITEQQLRDAPSAAINPISASRMARRSSGSTAPC